MKKLWAAVGLCLLALAPASRSHARTLHWEELDVDATLDAEGLLHVSERQNMVFDGDWNGGERRFRVEPGQTLTLVGVTRIDPETGAGTPLSEGDLSAVDRYRFSDAKTLRWRSRLPSDPPFSNRRIDYVLEYTLAGVLQKQGTIYSLNHDFGFADRDGPIDHFKLDLKLDPSWQIDGAFPGHWEVGPLNPGLGFVVRASMKSTRATPPSAVYSVPILADRSLARLVILAAILVFGLHYWLHDRARGRFAPLPPVSQVDEAWLNENVFDLLPEEVGTAIDDEVAAPEVSAVIARLVSEKKLKSESARDSEGKKTLRLTRLVPEEQFKGYEQKLVHGLFFGKESVTPDDVRKYYKSTGFDPAKLISDDLQKRLAAKGPFKDVYKPAARWRSLLFFCAAIVFAIDIFRHPIATDGRAIFVFLFSSAFCAGIGLMLAKHSSEKFTAWNGFLVFGVLVVPMPWVLATYVLDFDYSPTLFASFTCLTLMYLSSAFHLAMSRDGASRMERRRRLAAAKEYFKQELKSPHPRLHDSWFPYLLALGLGTGVDKWFKSFGAASRGAATAGSFGSSEGSSSSGSSSGWTGGGGSFGGAGASAGWAAAVGGFSAGVASPSSSGGGGGSSSGGGGGGGW